MVSSAEAYCVYRELPASPKRVFCADRHYLVYALEGTMRLETGGQSWCLPPARAALVEARREIEVTLPRKVTICSTLFAPSFVSSPVAPLSVFEMTQLARELVRECRRWGPDSDSLTPYARTMFEALAAVTWRLSQRPTPARMPTGRSAAVVKALELTSANLSLPPAMAQLAREVGVSPRTLARRFSVELGMSWRQSVRRMRMIRAIEELADSERSITEIAFEIGYTSLPAFNTAFRELVGKTPSEYRDEMGLVQDS